jgi:hypothetical protein
MQFSSWLEQRLMTEAKGKSVPVQMPKEKTNKVELSEPSPQRQVSGRRDTTFKSKKDQGSRSSRNRRAIDQSRD